MSVDVGLPREDVERFRAVVDRHDRFLLTTHVNSDGDGVGSQYALVHYLRSLGKRVRILNPTPLPFNYSFLNSEGLFDSCGKPQLASEFLKETDAILMCDFSVWKRLGPLAEPFERWKGFTMYVDHHLNGDDKTDARLIFDRACATGEIVYGLIDGMGGTIGRDIALGLYVAILTDTGSFRHLRDRHAAHGIAAELMRAGVSPPDVYHRIYEQFSPQRMRLMGNALLNMRFGSEGKLAWLAVSRKDLEAFGVQAEEMEGFVDLTREIRGVEIGILFSETSKGQAKASFRSNRRYSVNDLAGQFGGGGHLYAAGATSDLPLERFVERVVRTAEEKLAAPASQTETARPREESPC